MARGKKAKRAESEPVEGLWDLPDGWRWERLDEVAPVNPRRNFDEITEDASLTFLPMAAVAEQTGALRLDEQRPLASVRSGFTRFRSGDVIFAKITPCMENGKMAIIPDLPHGMGAGSTEFHVLEPQRVDGRYLYHWLSQRTFRQNAEHNMTGTAGQKRVPTEWLRSAPIPVPPTYEEQRQAVDKIEALFEKVDEAEATLTDARSGVETYRKSLLNAAVTGKLTADWRRHNPSQESGADLLQRILTERRARWETNPQNSKKKYVEPVGPETSGLPELPEEWTWASLQQLGDFGRGKSKHRPRNDPKLYGGVYPFIQTGIVAECDGDIVRYGQTYSELGLKQSKLWPAGTVCITIAANIAKTGVLAFEACFPDSIVGLTCLNGVAPDYIELFIRTVREELDRWAPATAQKNINLETLYQVAVPLPPTNEQNRIVELGRGQNGLEELLGAAGIFDQAATLRQSILAAAFRGELAV